MIWWRRLCPSRYTFFCRSLLPVSRMLQLVMKSRRQYDFSPFCVWRDTRIGFINLLLKYLTIWRHVLPVFLSTQRTSFLIFTLKSFKGLLKLGSCNSSWFNLCRGRWQVPIYSWQMTCRKKRHNKCITIPLLITPKWERKSLGTIIVTEQDPVGPSRDRFSPHPLLIASFWSRQEYLMHISWVV